MLILYKISMGQPAGSKKLKISIGQPAGSKKLNNTRLCIIIL